MDKDKILLGWCDRCSDTVYNTDRELGAYIADEVALCKKCNKLVTSKEIEDLDDQIEEFNWDNLSNGTGRIFPIRGQE